jgi:hypothetical protein
VPLAFVLLKINGQRRFANTYIYIYIPLNINLTKRLEVSQGLRLLSILPWEAFCK